MSLAPAHVMKTVSSAEVSKNSLFDTEPLTLSSELPKLVGVFAATISKLHMIPDWSSTRNFSKPHLIRAICLKVWIFSVFFGKVGCFQHHQCCVFEVDEHLSENCQLSLMLWV